VNTPAAPDRDWTVRTAPVEKSELRPARRVGNRGATGSVRDVGGQPPCLYKEYFTPSAHAARLDRLVAWRNGLSQAERDFLDDRCAWPLVTVTRDGQMTGFLMKSAPADFWAEMGGERHTLELQHLIHSRGAMALGIELPGPSERLEFVRDLAEILAFFEDHQIVYGDVSERNVFWTTRQRPRIFLIDCDNSRPTDFADRSVALPRNPSWRDPNLPEGSYPDTNSDRYTLAVFCYRVFYDYYRDPGQPIPALETNRSLLLIPQKAPHLPQLEGCLARGVSTPRFRPDARTWLSAIAATQVPEQDTDAAQVPTDSPVLRYSKERYNQAWAYFGVVCFAILGLAGACTTVVGCLQTGSSPGGVALLAASGLLWLGMFGGLGAICLAPTRPWWTLEVRGSVYLDHRQFASLKRYDLATAARAWLTASYDREVGYRLRLNLELPDGRARIPVPIRVLNRTARKDQEDILLAPALADALEEHPDPAVVRQAVADLRWCARASRRDLYRRLNSQRTSRSRTL
jgi:hypothetical protein